jgi:hypothetical protein
MTKTRLLLAILTWSAVAAAQPAGRRPPPAAPMFEIVVHDGKAALDRTIELSRTGEWTMRETIGKTARSSSGKLSASDVAAARADLAAATWSLRDAANGCKAMSVVHTYYRVDGKEMFHDFTCNPKVLDEASAKAIADVRRLLAPAL